MSVVVLQPGAPGRVMPIRVQRVVECLTLREFLMLCRALDEKYGKAVAASEQRGAWGLNPTSFFVGARRAEVRFDVLAVARDDRGLHVQVDLGSERVDFEWDNAA